MRISPRDRKRKQREREAKEKVTDLKPGTVELWVAREALMAESKHQNVPNECHFVCLCVLSITL